MEKGDWTIILIILITLAIIALLVMNLDKIFPTHTAQETLKQTINAT